MEAPPAAVLDLVEACRRFVKGTIGIELDGTPDTLPLLDHYLQGARDSREEVLALLAPAAGAYFGEVVRAAFDARWTGTDGDHDEWTLEIGDDAIRFCPVAVAIEAVLERDAPGGHGGFAVRDADAELARAALAAQPPIDPSDYYRLSTRFEVLELLVDRLVTRAAAPAGAGGAPGSGERPIES